MTGLAKSAIPRRVVLRALAWSVPVLAASHAGPRAGAAPAGSTGCADPGAVIDNCAAELPQEFSWTSFSTTAATSGGTSYFIQFTTRIQPGDPVPAEATGYRIDSLRVSGTTPDGSPFSVVPSIGETGSRAIWIRTLDSSLGFVLDVPWDAKRLVRSFDYTYNVVYLNLSTEIQTCTYVTTVRLAANGAVQGGVGSVAFSPPRLASCGD
ncbi:hypothetical protein [Mycolicibacter arupensis]|jgi:hypothetical protein|uniref:DUF4360 domain-containing protein n=1 Tax=Mycolicibacter arupensis TaxID=342002 RepID=A0A0F5MZI6_9MYCO|nr:hypothetical protein [Mycolicibacter arupensis]KAA1431960.1 hypothetical protein F0402_05890 [Mycolicibacter arupensis]KKC00025.1 hypothetical protein WR43_07085 [Mycolicibacter arupensis]MCV7274647.1 hypothetical protein [Mycolicibacter arupensis]OQZ97520.1 hypothetical protein BST15_10365 [Mycolicibacter arupensis]TXI53668.1 MAG: hypothetical protein E6Q54_16125 [Mycolicibacter arupensis]